MQVDAVVKREIESKIGTDVIEQQNAQIYNEIQSSSVMERCGHGFI